MGTGGGFCAHASGLPSASAAPSKPIPKLNGVVAFLKLVTLAGPASSAPPRSKLSRRDRVRARLGVRFKTKTLWRSYNNEGCIQRAGGAVGIHRAVLPPNPFPT